jgi:hypothetical protein
MAEPGNILGQEQESWRRHAPQSSCHWVSGQTDRRQFLPSLDLSDGISRAETARNAFGSERHPETVQRTLRTSSWLQRLSVERQNGIINVLLQDYPDYYGPKSRLCTSNMKLLDGPQAE